MWVHLAYLNRLLVLLIYFIWEDFSNAQLIKKWTIHKYYYYYYYFIENDVLTNPTYYNITLTGQISWHVSLHKLMKRLIFT